MFKCGKGPTQKVTLENKMLDPISINFSGPVLRFNQLDGVFQLTENPFAKKDNSKSKVDLTKLSADLQEVELRIEALKEVKEKMLQNVKKITEDSEWLQYMVKCDLMDKEYLEEMKENLGDYKQTIDEVREIEVNTTTGDHSHKYERIEHQKEVNKNREDTIHISDVESEKEMNAEEHHSDYHEQANDNETIEA